MRPIGFVTHKSIIDEALQRQTQERPRVEAQRFSGTGFQTVGLCWEVLCERQVFLGGASFVDLPTTPKTPIANGVLCEHTHPRKLLSPMVLYVYTHTPQTPITKDNLI
jgi:hypothetical protein